VYRTVLTFYLNQAAMSTARLCFIYFFEKKKMEAKRRWREDEVVKGSRRSQQRAPTPGAGTSVRCPHRQTKQVFKPRGPVVSLKKMQFFENFAREKSDFSKKLTYFRNNVIFW